MASGVAHADGDTKAGAAPMTPGAVSSVAEQAVAYVSAAGAEYGLTRKFAHAILLDGAPDSERYGGRSDKCELTAMEWDKFWDLFLPRGRVRSILYPPPPAAANSAADLIPGLAAGHPRSVLATVNLKQPPYAQHAPYLARRVFELLCCGIPSGELLYGAPDSARRFRKGVSAEVLQFVAHALVVRRGLAWNSAEQPIPSDRIVTRELNAPNSPFHSPTYRGLGDTDHARHHTPLTFAACYAPVLARALLAVDDHLCALPVPTADPNAAANGAAGAAAAAGAGAGTRVVAPAADRSLLRVERLDVLCSSGHALWATHGMVLKSAGGDYDEAADPYAEMAKPEAGRRPVRWYCNPNGRFYPPAAPLYYALHGMDLRHNTYADADADEVPAGFLLELWHRTARAAAATTAAAEAVQQNSAATTTTADAGRQRDAADKALNGWPMPHVDAHLRDVDQPPIGMNRFAPRMSTDMKLIDRSSLPRGVEPDDFRAGNPLLTALRAFLSRGGTASPSHMVQLKSFLRAAFDAVSEAAADDDDALLLLRTSALPRLSLFARTLALSTVSLSTGDEHVLPYGSTCAADILAAPERRHSRATAAAAARTRGGGARSGMRPTPVMMRVELLAARQLYDMFDSAQTRAASHFDARLTRLRARLVALLVGGKTVATNAQSTTSSASTQPTIDGVLPVKVCAELVVSYLPMRAAPPASRAETLAALEASDATNT